MQVAFDNKNMSLEDLALKNLGSCEVWDKDCRTLIRRLNRQNEKDFTNKKELLPKSFKGLLRLPVRSYRLVVAYDDPADRAAIEQAVSQVVDTQARARRVAPEAIAIHITDPIGNPTGQAGKIYAEVAGEHANSLLEYTNPLRVMHYPYGDEQKEAELFQLPPVHVALWDTRVDDRHCDLIRPDQKTVIFPTLADLPSDESPPESTDLCEQDRVGDYRISKRYDHATHIAGILAAQMNGKGIVGLNPAIRIWAWEVLNGDQFNKGDDPSIIMYQKYDLRPRVINISQTFQMKAGTKNTRFESLLFGSGLKLGLHNKTLIVAAAGLTQDGSGKEVGREILSTSGSECNVYPACWSNVPGKLRGLISVVALNSKGDDLLRDKNGEPLTNYGEVFDVGAVGEVRSTLHGNWFGVMGGSSVAAPYVTGLAALLYAKAESHDLDPKVAEVKQRILFSTDILPTLKGKSRLGCLKVATRDQFSCPGFGPR